MEVRHRRLTANGDEYLHVFCGIPKQASKGDGVGDCAQIDEQNGREGLDMQSVVEVAGKKRQLPLDVEDETAAKPSGPNRQFVAQTFVSHFMKKRCLLPGVLKLLSNLVPTPSSSSCTASCIVECVTIHLRHLHSSIHVLPLKTRRLGHVKVAFNGDSVMCGAQSCR